MDNNTNNELTDSLACVFVYWPLFVHQSFHTFSWASQSNRNYEQPVCTRALRSVGG